MEWVPMEIIVKDNNSHKNKRRDQINVVVAILKSSQCN